MFENIVDSWTEKESGILDKLYRSLRDGDYLNRIMILNSDLSDFTNLSGHFRPFFLIILNPDLRMKF